MIDHFFVTWVLNLDHRSWSVALWQCVTHCAVLGTAILLFYLTIPHRFSQWKSSLTFIVGLIILLLLVEECLKPLIARERPFITYNFTPWIKIPEGFSMPSGHSATAFYSATYASLLIKKHSIYFITLASLIAISRLYLGVHYFTDIIAGALLGLLIAFVTYLIHYAISHNKSFDI